MGVGSVAKADDDTPTLRWHPNWHRFSTAQYLLTGAMAGGLLATDQLLQPASQPRWQSNILLDAPVGNLLGARSESGRKAASEASDYLALGLVLYPFAVDTLMVAGVAHGSWDVAYQMAMISLQGVLFAKLVTGLTKDLVGRARPDYAKCDSGDELACGTSTESFVSGHTAGAFAGAGLICAHHQNLALYGDGAAGAVACGVGLAGATAVGTLRLVAGRHHLTDVLAGAAVGLTAGYLLPNLFNYDFGASREGRGQLIPIADQNTLGVGYVRTW